MKVLTIIPARGGSKGVVGKNKKLIAGKPLIEYSLDLSLELGENFDFWVSTDDEDIMGLAQNYENVELHKRKASLSTDESPIVDTIDRLLKLVEQSKECEFDLILLLQPTSPLRKAEDIRNAIKLLMEDESTQSVVSVCAMEDMHPARMYWKESGYLKPILDKFEKTRRQDISPAYYRNGCIYLVKRNAFKQNKEIMVKPMKAYPMPSSWLLNIDDPRDVLIAEAIIPEWSKGVL